MSETRTLIFIDYDDVPRIHEVRIGHELEDARLLFHDRVVMAYLAEAIPKAVISAWRAELEEARLKRSEDYERREYQRLKAKFESGG